MALAFGSNLPSDRELYYHVVCCPYFQTYGSGERTDLQKVLLPLFRHYHFSRLDDRVITYGHWISIMNAYFQRYVGSREEKGSLYEKVFRQFNNFYALFHSGKGFKTLFAYYPYNNGTIRGEVEAVLQSGTSITIYDYEFKDEPLWEDISYHAFKLQLASRILDTMYGVAPTRLGIVYPNIKRIHWIPYKPDEKFEEALTWKSEQFRRYGSQCAICSRPGCKPLIDKSGKFTRGILGD